MLRFRLEDTDQCAKYEAIAAGLSRLNIKTRKSLNNSELLLEVMYCFIHLYKKQMNKNSEGLVSTCLCLKLSVHLVKI